MTPSSPSASAADATALSTLLNAVDPRQWQALASSPDTTLPPDVSSWLDAMRGVLTTRISDLVADTSAQVGRLLIAQSTSINRAIAVERQRAHEITQTAMRALATAEQERDQAIAELKRRGAAEWPEPEPRPASLRPPPERSQAAPSKEL